MLEGDGFGELEAIALAVFRCSPAELDALPDDEWMELTGQALFVWKAYWTNLQTSIARAMGAKR